MAAIKQDKNRALAALTTAALGLPGLNTQAAVPAAQARGNVQYGYYQESDNRMRVDIYHGDFTLPVSDRLEFTFGVDRDTYSGATPAYSIPVVMADQPKIDQNQAPADAITAASGALDATKLAGYQGIMSFKEPYVAYTAAGVAIQNEVTTYVEQTNATLNAEMAQQLAAYEQANPNPGTPPTIPGSVTLNFDGIAAAVYGKANLNTDASCPGGSGCYTQYGMVVGTISDPLNPDGHLHRQGTSSDREVQYHADSSGIYIRALNGEAFSVSNLLFDSLQANGTGPNDFWEILGFNTDVNPSLSTGDGTNYATRSAYQQVSINQTGILTLDNAFSNINALWIHYRNYIQDVTNSGADFEVRVDDVNINPAQFTGATPEQIAWLNAYNAYKLSLQAAYAPQLAATNAEAEQLSANLEKEAVIAIYRNFLNKQVPPSTQTKQVMQTQPLETRTQPTFGAKYYFDNTTLALSGGQSTEPDFISTFGSANVSHELNNKLTTLNAGYSASSNKISRNTGSHSTEGHSHGEEEEIYPELNGSSDYHAFNLGLSQVLNKNSLFQFSTNYTRQSGYLTNPYKYVYVRGEITPEEYYQMFNSPESVNWQGITNLEIAGIDLFREVRPDLRNQFSFSSRLNQYLPSLDATVHLDYRYYFDDWDINSHTFELKWFQKLPWGLTLTPGFRYYSQSQADFFAPYFLAPRADGHYSSDFRLSGYGALSSGLTVSKQFNRGIRLELGMEYYTHQGDLKLGGGGESNYADFDYWMTHANLSVDLSAPGHIFGGGAGDEHHHHHHQHGAPAPAGIMYGHMMPRADDIMVGYRYLYANQDGSMMNGSSVAGDAAVRANACGAIPCSERPTEMAMHMHMLDLMYAPTDWLNLMLMPQLMDMDMRLAPLAGATEDSEHGSGHEVHALGDTLMAAMFKAFDMPGHHMHVGLGFSAPTGSVEETMDGQDFEDSVLQDYSMQPGSGTWDFIPSLTYAGHANGWSWGAQLSGTKRLQDSNKVGYALGDRFQATAWGGYSFTDWFSASVRSVYTEQGKIRGEFNRPHSISSPVDHTANSGGEFVDVGFGLNLTVPDGAFAGHNLGVEWLQPVSDKFNGYQLEREGSLYATWNYVF